MGELDPLLINFLKLDGSNADQNIDIGAWDFTTTGSLFASNLTLTNNLELDSDGGTACFGADKDLCIYHDGSDGFIDNNTGDLKLITAGETTLYNESDYGLRVHDNGLVSIVSSTGELWKFHRYRINPEGADGLFFRGTLFSFGTNSIPDSATADYCIGIGNDTLTNLTSGDHNLCIGAYSGLMIDTGTYNVGVGDLTLELTEDGQDNIAIGGSAMVINVHGNDNVAIGKGAFYDLTGSDNVAIGRNAGFESTSAECNVYIGYKSGEDATTADNNTCVGYLTGNTNNNSGCVLLGYEAGRYNPSSNRLFIENSNSANPLIYGEFDNDIVRINGTLEMPTTDQIQFRDPQIHIESANDGHLDLTADISIDLNSTVTISSCVTAHGYHYDVKTKTGAYTAAKNDDVLLCNGTFTLTLPSASGFIGKIFHIKNIGTGTITVDGDGGETIDGDATQAVDEQYDNLMIVCDGSNWFVL